jgi:hypothetical protein
MEPPTYRPLFTKLPPDRKERWQLVEKFISIWHGPIKNSDRYTEQEIQACEQQLAFRFPTALREWYLLAGKMKKVWSNQDHLDTPEEIVKIRSLKEPYYRKFQEKLFFYGEAQGNEYWTIRPEDMLLDDPPVYRTEEDPGMVSPTLTAFAIQVLLNEATFSANVLALGDFSGLKRPYIQEIKQKLIPCDIPDRYSSAIEPLRAYEGNGIIVVTLAHEQIQLAALNHEACEQLSKELRDELQWAEE